jgi:hypothetical protein
MSEYLLKRGVRTIKRRRHAHLAKYNAHGEVIGAWCPETGFEVQSNVPWGLKVCKHCLRLANS